MATIPKKLTLELNLPDEVLIEILLRLPLLSLQLFRSVSKHWLSLITSEYFTQHLRKPRIETPCGLFIRRSDSEHYDFVTLGPKVTSFPLPAKITNAGGHFRIMQSCNGLLLCSNLDSSVYYYYVYNPYTKNIKDISFAPKSYSTNMILAFDPTKSPYYKVVIIAKAVDYYTRQIQIYSSETCKWSICGPPFPDDSFEGFCNGFYCNNAIHWITDWTNHYHRFDIVDHPMVTNIQTPTLDNVVYTQTKLFESRGSLLLLINEYSCLRYHVFEMREEASKWSVKYIVDDPSFLDQCKRFYRYFIFVCMVLGERGDDSFMVIELDNKIVRYKFESKTVSTLCSFVSPPSWYSSVPIIASLAGV